MAMSWISASRAGVNFTDLQCRAMGIQTMVDRGGAPRRLGPEGLPIVPGGEVAGTTSDGRRVVAICAAGGYAKSASPLATSRFPYRTT